jgi:hypothetical protein
LSDNNQGIGDSNRHCSPAPDYMASGKTSEKLKKEKSNMAQNGTVSPEARPLM